MFCNYKSSDNKLSIVFGVSEDRLKYYELNMYITNANTYALSFDYYNNDNGTRLWSIKAYKWG